MISPNETTLFIFKLLIYRWYIELVVLSFK
jgi:hypothetical protein